MFVNLVCWLVSARHVRHSANLIYLEESSVLFPAFLKQTGGRKLQLGRGVEASRKRSSCTKTRTSR